MRTTSTSHVSSCRPGRSPASSPSCHTALASSLQPNAAVNALSRRKQQQCASGINAISSSSSRGGRSGSAIQRRRPLLQRAAAEAEAEAEAPQQSGALVPDRQGYRSFPMEGCEFLIKETPDGKLDLRDAFVAKEAGEEGSERHWQRIEGVEGLEGQPQAYKEVPWYTEWAGDHVNEVPGKVWIWRYFLVPIETEEPELRLSFEGIWVLDAATGNLGPCEVHRLAPPDTPPEHLRLRIRDEVVTIDTDESLPDWEAAAQARMAGVAALSELEMERLGQYLEALEEARAAGTVSQEEYEEARDVSWLSGVLAGRTGGQAVGGSIVSDGEDGVQMVEFEEAEAEEDVMGGWDEDLLEDLLPQYDDEAEETEYEEFDSPATDY